MLAVRAALPNLLEQMHKWRKEHGDIFTLRLGNKLMVVISSYKVNYKVFTTVIISSYEVFTKVIISSYKVNYKVFTMIITCYKVNYKVFTIVIIRSHKINYNVFSMVNIRARAG